MPKFSQKFLLSVVSLLLLGIWPSISGGAFIPTHLIDFLNLQDQYPLLGALRAYTKAKIPEAWDFLNKRSLDYSLITIGIIDTGFDAQHPEFEPNEFFDVGNTPTSAKTDAGIAPGISHGTNIVGIIGANNRSATSAENYISPNMNGIVSGVRNLRYTLEVRKYKQPLPDLVAFVWETFTAARAGSKIVNLSFDTTPMATFVFSGVFRLYSDILFVVSAGNAGISAELVAPANLGLLDNVITVGATDLSDAWFGDNFGDPVGIAAPGEFVYSPTFFSPESLDLLDYTFFGDTSASAPMVTGVAAILKSLKPDLTPAEIKHILQISADPIKTDQPLGSGCFDPAHNPHDYNGCRLNAFRAAEYALAEPAIILRQFNAPVSGNGRGMAFDGMHLYYSNLGDTRVFKTDTRGNLLRIIETDSPAPVRALAWDGRELWGSTGSGAFGTINLTTGSTTLKFYFNYPAGDSCYNLPPGYTDGFAYDPQTDSFWISDDAGQTIYNISRTGQMLRSFSFRAASQCNSGIAIGGNSVWAILYDEPNPDDIYFTSRLARFTKDGQEFFPKTRLMNSPNEDAAFDPITFAPDCALWTIQTGFETERITNKITAFRVPCR